MEIITVFDYAQLDTETRIVVKQRTLEIRAQIKHSAHAVADIGEKLIDVRSKLLEGYFDAWLRAEFGWTKTTAYRFIRVAEQFGSNNLLLDNAAPSALYLLAEPSTPEEIRQEFIEKAEAGEPVKHKEVKAKIGGIPKTTIKPLVADTAEAGYSKDKSLRFGRKDSVRVESQANRYDDFNQDTEGSASQKSPEEEAAIGLLESLGYAVIPPEATNEPTCAYCGKAFK